MTLSGLILMGGKSSRMGQDKAHIKINQISLWEHAHNTLKNFTQKNYFSLNKNNLNFNHENIIQDIFIKSYGPLGGIISGFKKYPNTSFFVLACDLPNFNTQAAEYLLKNRNKNKLATVYINQENKIEPLCAIYESKIFFDLLKFWAQDILCPRKILNNLDIEKINIPNPDWVFNMNSAEDYKNIKKIKEQNLEKNKKIKIFYYASLREQVGSVTESLNTKSQTLADLFDQIREKYKISYKINQLRVAQNNEIVSWDSNICDGDSIIFMPPVSGG